VLIGDVNEADYQQVWEKPTSGVIPVDKSDIILAIR